MESISEKSCENRLIFGEVMGKSLMSCSLTHDVFLIVMIGLSKDLHDSKTTISHRPYWK